MTKKRKKYRACRKFYFKMNGIPMLNLPGKRSLFSSSTKSAGTALSQVVKYLNGVPENKFLLKSNEEHLISHRTKSETVSFRTNEFS
jgi:hypothetical protein